MSRRPGAGGEVPWQKRAHLECVGCDQSEELGPHWRGCARCGAPLVVVYEPVELGRGALGERLEQLRCELLPVRADLVAELGQGRTPLVRAPRAGSNVWFKLEGQNPSGSHKDRFHAIAAPLARALRAPAAVTASTGNHGAAAAAFLAAAGVPALVLLHPRAPEPLRVQITLHGAAIAVVPEQVRWIVSALVDQGWYPSTSADPALVGRSNPYGQEGYKAIAYEVVARLGGVPGILAVPAASGDTVYGVWRGFRDVHEHLQLPMPTILACQPSDAAPLVATARAGATAPVEVEPAQSIALSAADSRSGWQASVALRDGGIALAVPDHEIEHATARLAGMGHYVEPASALSLAGLEQARGDGLVDPDATAVCVLTSSGQNWTRDLAAIAGDASPMTEFSTLWSELGRRGLPVPRSLEEAAR